MKLHDPVRRHNHEHHEQQQQVDLAQLGEHILVMKGFQIEGDHGEEQGHKKELAKMHPLGIVFGVRGARVFSLEGI